MVQFSIPGKHKLHSLRQYYFLLVWILSIFKMFQHGQDFSNFPFDGKMFVLELESFSFTGKDILYNWKDFTEELKNYKAFQLSPEIGFYDFSLVGHRIQTHLVSLISLKVWSKSFSSRTIIGSCSREILFSVVCWNMCGERQWILLQYSLHSSLPCNYSDPDHLLDEPGE